MYEKLKGCCLVSVCCSCFGTLVLGCGVFQILYILPVEGYSEPGFAVLMTPSEIPRISAGYVVYSDSSLHLPIGSIVAPSWDYIIGFQI